MLLNVLKEIILNFQSQELEIGVMRTFGFQEILGKAFVCIGVRRCGKSTLLMQIADRLVEEGVSKKNILYIVSRKIP